MSDDKELRITEIKRKIQKKREVAEHNDQYITWQILGDVLDIIDEESEEYKGKKFDMSKGGVHVSNPPEDWGLAICHTCEMIIETPDWDKPANEVFCDDCREEAD